MSFLDWQPRVLQVKDDSIFPPPDSRRSPRGFRRIYLLVHGFNNTPSQANDSYAKFKSRMKSVIGSVLSVRIWEFYWPGYESTYEGVTTLLTEPSPAPSLVTARYYYEQVPKAVRIGKMLGDYIVALQSGRRATEVVLIGHSLGCRLILEALTHVHNVAPETTFPAMLLMAGAVPVSSVEESGELRPGVELCQRRFVLYSRRDLILFACFRPGQWRAAAEADRWPQAVGRYGNPDGCWTGRERVPLGHGKYWSDEVSTPHVARVFGKRAERDLGVWEIVPRELPSKPPKPGRKPLARTLPV